jgi:hypothetical protein
MQRWGNDGAYSEVVRRGKSVNIMCVMIRALLLQADCYSIGTVVRDTALKA